MGYESTRKRAPIEMPTEALAARPHTRAVQVLLHILVDLRVQAAGSMLQGVPQAGSMYSLLQMVQERERSQKAWSKPWMDNARLRGLNLQHICLCEWLPVLPPLHYQSSCEHRAPLRTSGRHQTPA